MTKLHKMKLFYLWNHLWTSPSLPQITQIDTKKLKKILKGFGEYPDKYRNFIWRLLLKVQDVLDPEGVYSV